MLGLDHGEAVQRRGEEVVEQHGRTDRRQHRGAEPPDQGHPDHRQHEHQSSAGRPDQVTGGHADHGRDRGQRDRRQPAEHPATRRQRTASTAGAAGMVERRNGDQMHVERSRCAHHRPHAAGAERPQRTTWIDPEDQLGGTDVPGELQQRFRHVLPQHRVQPGTCRGGQPPQLHQLTRRRTRRTVSPHHVDAEQLRRPAPPGQRRGPPQQQLSPRRRRAAPPRCARHALRYGSGRPGHPAVLPSRPSSAPSCVHHAGKGVTRPPSLEAILTRP